MTIEQVSERTPDGESLDSPSPPRLPSLLAIGDADFTLSEEGAERGHCQYVVVVRPGESVTVVLVDDNLLRARVVMTECQARWLRNGLVDLYGSVEGPIRRPVPTNSTEDRFDTDVRLLNEPFDLLPAAYPRVGLMRHPRHGVFWKVSPPPDSDVWPVTVGLNGRWAMSFLWRLASELAVYHNSDGIPVERDIP